MVIKGVWTVGARGRRQGHGEEAVPSRLLLLETHLYRERISHQVKGPTPTRRIYTQHVNNSRTNTLTTDTTHTPLLNNTGTLSKEIHILQFSTLKKNFILRYYYIEKEV